MCVYLFFVRKMFILDTCISQIQWQVHCMMLYYHAVTAWMRLPVYYFCNSTVAYFPEKFKLTVQEQKNNTYIIHTYIYIWWLFLEFLDAFVKNVTLAITNKLRRTLSMPVQRDTITQPSPCWYLKLMKHGIPSIKNSFEAKCTCNKWSIMANPDNAVTYY